MAKYEHKKYLIDKKVLNQYKRIKSIDKSVDKFKPSLKYIVEDTKDQISQALCALTVCHLFIYLIYVC